MSNARIIANETDCYLMVTLCIQKGGDHGQLHGTVKFSLKPGESRSIAYGDVRNCLLSGLVIRSETEGKCIVRTGLVEKSGDTLDIWLNNGLQVTIDTPRMTMLAAGYPDESQLYRYI